MSANKSNFSRLSKGRNLQLGLTLVELLVALLISTVIAIAAVAALTVSRQGFTTVDAASKLRDDARFATEMLQRFGVQAGFNDVQDASTAWPKTALGYPVGNPVPSISGFNNALISETDPENSSTARTGTATLGFGSDILIMRYQVAATFPNSGKADRSMIDCYGVPNPDTDLPFKPGDRQANIIFVGVDADGEPGLRCKTSKVTTLSQPLVSGVENFQVLYGVDGVTANTEATATKTNVVTNYLRADEILVTVDPTGEKTSSNWRRVRSIKIGMIIRGAVGSAQSSTTQTYYPFGRAVSASGGTPGSALSSASDPGTIFTPAADGRLRQVVTFTIHLRNEQGL